MIKYRYCPYCSGNVKKKEGFIQCLSCGKKVFSISKPAAGVFVVKGDKVLLVKRGIPPRKGFYDFPGGFLHMGEHPESGAKREILEETGLKIKIIGLLGIYINEEYTYQSEKIFPQDTVYIANIVGGKPTPKDDVKSLHWVSIANPPKEVSFESVKLALEDLRKWHLHKRVKGKIKNTL